VPEAAPEGDIPASESLSSQSLRRSRASGRTNTAGLQTAGPAPSVTSSLDTHLDQKAANEAFFESLGAVSPPQKAFHCVGLTIGRTDRPSNDRSANHTALSLITGKCISTRRSSTVAGRSLRWVRQHPWKPISPPFFRAVFSGSAYSC
jgi:hypothetical protein